MGFLHTPVTIGNVRVRNRIAMAPMTTRFATADGCVTQRMIDYYVERARGGTGLIIIEMGAPHPSGRHRVGEIGLYHDRYLEGLSALARAVKAAGAVPGIQIGHAGGRTTRNLTGCEPAGPSPVEHLVYEKGRLERVVPRELSVDEIKALVMVHAHCAERLVRAGFEVIELHGAHGYLIAQFLSPLENLRTDEYGGDRRRRARFALEVIRACRSAVGDRAALTFRFSADEFAPGGFGPADALELTSLLEESGIDALHVSAGCYRSGDPHTMTPPMNYPEACYLPYARAVKQRTGLPVMAVGRMNDPVSAEAALARREADLIVLGRQLIADPEWAAKAATGRTRSIRYCLSCNSCVDGMRDGDSLGCAVNGRVGRESECRLERAVRPLRVLVIGGGPAGLEAARLAAARGHSVTLVEASRRLGGQLRRAAEAPFFENVVARRQPFERFLASLAAQLEELGVAVQTGRRVRAQDIGSYRPNVVVVATGARYRPGPGLVVALSRPFWALMGRGRPGGPFARAVKDWLLRRARRPVRTLGGLEAGASWTNPLSASSVGAADAEPITVHLVGDCREPSGTRDAIRSATDLACRL